MRAVVFVLLCVCVWVVAWAEVILDVRQLRYREILALLQGGTVWYQGIWIDTPLKGYHGRFAPTEEVYDFSDVGNVHQRGSRETHLGSREEFDQLMALCASRQIRVYARVRLFEQREGFSTNAWEKSDFYPDYTVAFGRDGASKRLRGVVSALRGLPVNVWVVDVRGLSREYQQRAAAWVRQNFSGALVLADAVGDASISAVPFSRWQRFLWERRAVTSPDFGFSGVHVLPDVASSDSVFYYFLLRQRNMRVVIPHRARSAYEAVEAVRPFEWRDLRMTGTNSDHVLGVSARGAVSLYIGERVRFTNFMLELPAQVRPRIGTSYLMNRGGQWEGVFVPWSFSLWAVER